MYSDPANEAQGDGGPMRGDTPRVRKKVVKQMRFLESKHFTTIRRGRGDGGRRLDYDDAEGKCMK